MKILLMIITILLSTVFDFAHGASDAQTKTQHAHAGHGSHGMAVFGGRRALYASHLPMFHTPHAAQVMMQIRLGDAEQDQWLRARLSEKPELWTLAPTELFDLSAFADTRSAHPFNASFSRGHFERGGKTEIKTAQVIVERVIFFQTLSATVSSASTQRYQVIGDGCEQFAFKHIIQRPDFDFISKLPGCKKYAELLSLDKPGLTPPTSLEWHGLLGNKQTPTLIYFEAGDLQ
jgi:hypothetical protein